MMNLKIYRFNLLTIKHRLSLLFIFITLYGVSQPSIVQQCEFSVYEEGRFSVWLDHLPTSPGTDYRFEPSPAIMTIFDDGTARLTGRIVNLNDSTLRWDIFVSFKEEQNWEEWSAQGRTFKSSLDAVSTAEIFHPEWTFWELDDVNSYFASVSGSPFEGDTLYLRHRPNDISVGFQLGRGANDRNENFGFSGWFDYSFSKGETWDWAGSGDINTTASCDTLSCDIEIDTTIVSCNDSGEFSIEIALNGSGEGYLITDSFNFTEVDFTSSSTYLFGNYPSESSIQISIINNDNPSCDIILDSISENCPLPPTCGIEDLFAQAVSISDDSFQVEVSFEGEVGSYLLSDISIIADSLRADPQFISSPDSVFILGPYLKETLINISLADTTINNCIFTLAGLTVDIPQENPCDLDSVNVEPRCIGTSGNFTIDVFFSGNGTEYFIRDVSQTTVLSNLESGTHAFGSFPSGDTVRLEIGDRITGCVESLGSFVTATCISCELAISTVSSICVGDSIEVSVTITGSGENFQLFDNQGTPSLNNLTSGSYILGRYPAEIGDAIIVSANDPTKPECDTVSLAVPEIPCPICDLAITNSSPRCVGDSIEVSVTITGSGENIQLFDNSGTPPLGGLTAGTYILGRYSSTVAAPIIVSITDSSQSACDTISQEVPGINCISDIDSIDILPEPFCDLSNEDQFFIRLSIPGNGTLYRIRAIANGLPPVIIDSVSANEEVILGPFNNNQRVTIAISDLTVPSATRNRILPSVTEDCTPEPPANDSCLVVENMEMMLGDSIFQLSCGERVEGTTRGATFDDEVCAYCGTFADAPGVWYSFKGTGDSTSISVCCTQPASGYDARMMIFEFGCDTLSCITGNDLDPNDSTCATATFFSRDQQEYLVFVTGANGVTGEFSIDVACGSNINVQSPEDEPVTSVPNPFSEEHLEGRAFFIGDLQPNPASNLTMTSIIAPETKSIQYNIYNAAGQLSLSKEIMITPGTQDITIPIDGMSNGFYIIQWTTNQTILKSQRLLILKED